MKINILLGLVLATGLTACFQKDLLDPTQTTTLNEERVFSDSALTRQFLFAVYSEAGANSYQRRYSAGGLSEGSDESTSRLFGGTQSYVMVALGTINSNATGPYGPVYVNGYVNIRRVNIFLKNLPNTPLSEGLQTRLAGEARFLRAWYYWQMLQNFGGVPLIGDSLFKSTDDIRSPRGTYADCVSYISSELDAAKELLPAPDDVRPEDYGIPTKGACLALKSRLLLYAASPLQNGGGYEGTTAATKPLVGYPDHDDNRWVLAKNAAAEVINSGYYELVEDNSKPGLGFYKLFITRYNREFIFQDMKANNRDMERHLLPPSREGTPNTCPSYAFTKQFGMNNGKAITDPTSGYDPAKPFDKRDPRFNYSFIYNGSGWRTKASSTTTQPVWTYVGAAKDGYDASLVFTGIFFRKFCNEASTGQSGTNGDRVMPLIRYAEILLNFAEAANESNDITGAYDKVKMIRKRAGITAGADGNYGLAAGMSKENMRKVIQNERAVELMYEDHRYWDTRRWKIAMATQNVTLTRIKITQLTGGTYKYEELAVEKNPVHTMRENNHYFPIPMSETAKNPNILQNPGY